MSELNRLALDPPRAIEPPVGVARWRVSPEDFVVDEVLGFEPSGQGEHVLVTVRKRGANTLWVARELARHAGVRPQDVGFAGLKDRHAVTTQSFTVPLRRQPLEMWQTVVGEGYEVIAAARHSRKLPRGALRGNRFRLVLRDFAGDRSAFEARVAQMAIQGAPNYFGAQRFGRDLANLAPGAPPRFALSALRSLLFNAVLAERIERGDWCTLYPGERANLDGSNASFVVTAEDPALPSRLAAQDIHPTGPLWGEGESGITGEIAQLETTVVERHAPLRERLRAASLEPARRPLRVAVRDLTLRWLPGELACELQFFLRAGSFASAVVRELLATPVGNDSLIAEEDDA